MSAHFQNKDWDSETQLKTLQNGSDNSDDEN